MTSFPRISTPQNEGQLRVSKWLKFQVLLDADEMEDLFRELGPFFIFLVSEVVSKETALLEHAQFLAGYRHYIEILKKGEIPENNQFRKIFSSVFTTTPDIMYAQDLGKERYLIKALKPVIQLQAHHFFLSDIDGKYHPMVLSDQSFSWGLQFSYPQIYQDPKSTEFSKVTTSAEFPNTELFVRLTKALRKNSMPTPFSYKGVKTYVPIRIGKKCLSWIANHAQLKKRGLEVVYGS